MQHVDASGSGRLEDRGQPGGRVRVVEREGQRAPDGLDLGAVGSVGEHASSGQQPGGEPGSQRADVTGAARDEPEPATDRVDERCRGAERASAGALPDQHDGRSATGLSAGCLRDGQRSGDVTVACSELGSDAGECCGLSAGQAHDAAPGEVGERAEVRPDDDDARAMVAPCLAQAQVEDRCLLLRVERGDDDDRCGLDVGVGRVPAATEAATEASPDPGGEQRGACGRLVGRGEAGAVLDEVGGEHGAREA